MTILQIAGEALMGLTVGLAIVLAYVLYKSGGEDE